MVNIEIFNVLKREILKYFYNCKILTGYLHKFYIFNKSFNKLKFLGVIILKFCQNFWCYKE